MVRNGLRVSSWSCTFGALCLVEHVNNSGCPLTCLASFHLEIDVAAIRIIIVGCLIGHQTADLANLTAFSSRAGVRTLCFDAG